MSPPKSAHGESQRSPRSGPQPGGSGNGPPPESQLPLPLTLPQPHPASTSIICTDLLHDNFISSLAPERWIGQRGDCRFCVGLINLLPLCEASTEGGESGHHSSLPAASTVDRRGGGRKAWERGNLPALELLRFSLHVCYEESYLSHGWQGDLPSPPGGWALKLAGGKGNKKRGGGVSLPPSHHWSSGGCAGQEREACPQ